MPCALPLPGPAVAVVVALLLLTYGGLALILMLALRSFRRLGARPWAATGTPSWRRTRSSTSPRPMSGSGKDTP